MDCGEASALSTRVTLPVIGPETTGENATLTLHSFAAASCVDAEHGTAPPLAWLKLAGRLSAVVTSGTLPVLPNRTVCAGDTCPAGSAAKLSGAAPAATSRTRPAAPTVPKSVA